LKCGRWSNQSLNSLRSIRFYFLGLNRLPVKATCGPRENEETEDLRRVEETLTLVRSYLVKVPEGSYPSIGIRGSHPLVSVDSPLVEALVGTGIAEI